MSESTFKAIGGEFILPFSQLGERLKNIRAFVFDWDGVFNPGTKGEGAGSPFSEADSAGTNFLRYGFWRRDDVLPPLAIITGEDNPSARLLARREHFSSVYQKVGHKADALKHFAEANQLGCEQIAFVFDDVMDLSAAKLCGLRFLVRRDAAPMLRQYAIDNQLADYMTGQSGGQSAVREVVELILATVGNYADVVDERVAYSENYRQYLQQRNTPQCQFFGQTESGIKALD